MQAEAKAALVNAAAVTRDYTVKPRLRYQTVSAVSGPLIVLENVKV
jgi:V-type H+-transporting ATPase subunit B